MEVSEQLTGFELEDLMSWTVSNLQRPFREDFSLEKSGIIAEKESQIFGRRFVGFDRPKKRRPFSFPDVKKGVSAQSITRPEHFRMLRLIFLLTRRTPK